MRSAWKTVRVFISSTFRDMHAVRDHCLHEIDVCRPFFLGILGERYGWVPTRYPADALKKFGWIQQHTGKSLTELEIHHSVLQNQQMRGHAYFYFRDSN